MGDWVFVKFRPYKQYYVTLCTNQKLGMKYFWPFSSNSENWCSSLQTLIASRGKDTPFTKTTSWESNQLLNSSTLINCKVWASYPTSLHPRSTKCYQTLIEDYSSACSIGWFKFRSSMHNSWEDLS